MNLELPPNLLCPSWPKLEKLITARLGSKMCKTIGYIMRNSVAALKTYFNDVYNPMIKRDFKEKTTIAFQDGKLYKGKPNKILNMNI